jgi:hypothetical protein
LKTPLTSTSNGLARGLMLVAALAALLVLAAPAAAAKSCGRVVIDDWWDGRIDGTYDLHCYDDAIEQLPRDVRDYSSAEEDIRRALQAAMREEPAPPNREPPSGGESPAPPEAPPTETDTGSETDTNGAPPTGPGDEPPGPEVAPPLDTESASSVPVPLLILAGLALLLIAGGSAGYLIRRVQARRVPPAEA